MTPVDVIKLFPNDVYSRHGSSTRALYCNAKVQVRAMNTISCLWLVGALPYGSPTFGVSHAYGKNVMNDDFTRIVDRGDRPTATFVTISDSCFQR